MHPPLKYYSLFIISCFTGILCPNPSTDVPENLSPVKKLTTVESSSIIPTVRANPTTIIFDLTSSNSSKQAVEEVTTQRYDTIQNLNQVRKTGSRLVVPTTNIETISTYRLKNEDGNTCILMTVDALITFIYVTNLAQNEESDVYVPNENHIDVAGDCSDGEKSSLILKWKSFLLRFDFDKTPGGERWYVNSIALNFNTKDTSMQHPNHPNTVVEAETTGGDLLFPTPVGRSFKCHREIKVTLTDPKYLDIKIVLLLRELTLEPFIFKNDDFGPEYMCTASGSGAFRSETAPFLFGSLFSLASICTVSIYAVYRYLKVNKVQYDAME